MSCNNRNSWKFQKYISTRKNTFFETFSTLFAYIFQLSLKYASLAQETTTLILLYVIKSSIKKVLNTFIRKIKTLNIEGNKLGAGGQIALVDNIMLIISVSRIETDRRKIEPTC